MKRGSQIWPQRGSDWPQMDQIRDFFRSDFSTFWRGAKMYWNLIWKSPGFVPTEPKCTEIWSEKVPDLSHWGLSEPLWCQTWTSVSATTGLGVKSWDNSDPWPTNSTLIGWEIQSTVSAVNHAYSYSVISFHHIAAVVAVCSVINSFFLSPPVSLFPSSLSISLSICHLNIPWTAGSILAANLSNFGLFQTRW